MTACILFPASIFYDAFFVRLLTGEDVGLQLSNSEQGDLRDLGLDLLSNDEDLILSQACEETEMNYCFGEI